MKQLLDYKNRSGQTGQEWRADTLLLKERHGILRWDHPFGFGVGRSQGFRPRSHTLRVNTAGETWPQLIKLMTLKGRGGGGYCTRWKNREVSTLMDCHDPNLTCNHGNVALRSYLHVHTERLKLIQCSCWRRREANCNLISFNHNGETGQTHVPTTYWTHKQAFVAAWPWKRTITEDHNELSWERDSWCVPSVSS